MGSFGPLMSVSDAVSWAIAALTATTVMASITAVAVEPGHTATYDCAAISAIAELLSDLVQHKYHRRSQGVQWVHLHPPGR